FSSRRRHTRFDCDWSSDVCSSDLGPAILLWLPSPEEIRARAAPGTPLVLHKGHLTAAPFEAPEIASLVDSAHAILLVKEGAIARSEERRVGKECGARGWTDSG